MSKLNVFPHGFKSCSSMREKILKLLSITIETLQICIDAYINNEVDFNSWDFKLNILEGILSLIRS